MEITIDIEKLRADLKDYYGTASIYNKLAMMELIKVDTASDNEIVNMAIKNGLNLYDYEINNRHRR